MNREPFDKAKARFVCSFPFSPAQSTDTKWLNKDSGVQSDQGLNVATRLIADLPPPSASDYAHKEEVARHITGMAYLGLCHNSGLKHLLTSRQWQLESIRYGCTTAPSPCSELCL